ncbi:MAG: hypothetical protein CK538_07175 [Opitutia bacterium]|nr:MAG: hypothetical protein CK538_07175 [Opitutae bacterium]
MRKIQPRRPLPRNGFHPVAPTRFYGVFGHAQVGGVIGSKPMIAGIRFQISIGAGTDGGGIRHKRESRLGETAKAGEIRWRLQGRVRRLGPARKQRRAFLGSIQAADPAITRLRMGVP